MTSLSGLTCVVDKEWKLHWKGRDGRGDYGVVEWGWGYSTGEIRQESLKKEPKGDELGRKEETRDVGERWMPRMPCLLSPLPIHLILTPIPSPPPFLHRLDAGGGRRSNHRSNHLIISNHLGAHSFNQHPRPLAQPPLHTAIGIRLLRTERSCNIRAPHKAAGAHAQ